MPYMAPPCSGCRSPLRGASLASKVEMASLRGAGLWHAPAVRGKESRLRESAQGDNWSFCLTAGKIGPRIRREHEQETAGTIHRPLRRSCDRGDQGISYDRN